MLACLAIAKDRKGIWGTLRNEFISFSKKNMDEERIWVTLGDALISHLQIASARGRFYMATKYQEIVSFLF
jgi:predicted RNA-binding protein (virulence factor B family)